MKAIFNVPIWHPAGFKKEDDIEYPCFKCLECENNCEFLIKGDKRLPETCCRRGLKAKSINHQAEGEAPSESEILFLKTIQERGER